MRVRNAQGVFVPVSCTREFTQMMECTAEEFIAAETREPLCTVVAEDRDDTAYLLENGIARNGENHLTVRKRTMKGNIIWVDLHYSIFTSQGAQYAYCNYYNVTQIMENEQRMRVTYDGIIKELKAVSNESLAVIRSNLTKGIVEEISGRDLFEGDAIGARVEDLIQTRLNSMPMEADRKHYQEHFSLERLEAAFEKDEAVEPLVIFSRRQSGKHCFVRYSSGMRRDPLTGDITVFGIETEYNSEKVNEVLNQKVLAQQYDMISYLVNESYGVVIGDARTITRGSIFPREMNGNYSDYLRDQVVPAVKGTDEEKGRVFRALSLETVRRELEQSESYTVSVTCEIEGETYYKRFTYYPVDRDARFYILLKSDYTDVQREQIERNEQLKNALRDANQANVAKTAFLSSMSHKIRTPMNTIIGLDSIALSEPGISDRTRFHLEQIGDSARHLLALINDILDVSRIESGRMFLKNEEFSFSSMLEQVNVMIGGQCRDKRLRYDCAVHGQLDEHYIGDDMKLKQVLINILGNAVKFTPEGGTIGLEVDRSAHYDGKSVVRFRIRDTGIGMDEAYIPRIFQPFSQEDATRTSKYGGTGLGLAITKHIVELMNGSIDVQSTKGKGSLFTVTVTLADSSRDSLGEMSIKPKDMRVLVIDDDPVACEHAKIVLEEAGISTELCQSGAEAVELVRLSHARRTSFNLILVDLRMPEKDGIETTREIREIIGDETAIIILTAYNWDDVMEDALRVGVDSFIAKPLLSGSVLHEFSEALRRKNLANHRAKIVDLAGKRVLLAEDVQINAMIMEQLLTMKGLSVDIAEDGQKAVDLFLEHPEGYYDAVLMDIRMPVMDGLAATEAIRSFDREDSASVPIIALTANAFDEDVQRSLQAGMNAHLSKPVEPERLYQILSELIRE